MKNKKSKKIQNKKSKKIQTKKLQRTKLENLKMKKSLNEKFENISKLQEKNKFLENEIEIFYNRHITKQNPGPYTKHLNALNEAENHKTKIQTHETNITNKTEIIKDKISNIKRTNNFNHDHNSWNLKIEPMEYKRKSLENTMNFKSNKMTSQSQGIYISIALFCFILIMSIIYYIKKQKEKKKKEEGNVLEEQNDEENSCSSNSNEDEEDTTPISENETDYQEESDGIKIYPNHAIIRMKNDAFDSLESYVPSPTRQSDSWFENHIQEFAVSMNSDDLQFGIFEENYLPDCSDLSEKSNEAQEVLDIDKIFCIAPK